MSASSLKRNFFILSTRRSNFEIFMRHMVYAANLQRPEHRAMANIKEGDLCFIYVMEERAMYGVFEAAGRVFEGPAGLRLTGRWPHMVPLRVWGSHLGALRGGEMADFMSFMSREIETIGDVSELHRKYLNTLLHKEGVKLLQFFIRRCDWSIPSPQASPIVGPPPDARGLLKGGVREYGVELYLLQNLDRLEMLVGSGLSEVYNQLYGYGRRYLDILTIHREGERFLKATVMEIKADIRRLEEGLEELVHYLHWVSDKVTGDPEATIGMILAPMLERETIPPKESVSRILEPFGLNADKILWMRYEPKDGDLVFTPKV